MTAHATRLLAATLVACGTLATFTAPAHAADGAMPVAPAAAPARERAIFSVSDADPQKWSLTLGNISNAIDGFGGPEHVDIELVVYGPAIAMLKKDSPVADRVAAALAHGVRVAACQNSMRGFKLEQADLVPGVTPVPSGVVELIKREHAGYAYVRS